jgi:hypothetical protein
MKNSIVVSGLSLVMNKAAYLVTLKKAYRTYFKAKVAELKSSYGQRFKIVEDKKNPAVSTLVCASKDIQMVLRCALPDASDNLSSKFEAGTWFVTELNGKTIKASKQVELSADMFGESEPKATRRRSGKKVVTQKTKVARRAAVVESDDEEAPRKSSKSGVKRKSKTSKVSRRRVEAKPVKKEGKKVTANKTSRVKAKAGASAEVVTMGQALTNLGYKPSSTETKMLITVVKADSLEAMSDMSYKKVTVKLKSLAAAKPKLANRALQLRTDIRRAARSL